MSSVAGLDLGSRILVARALVQVLVMKRQDGYLQRAANAGHEWDLALRATVDHGEVLSI